MLPGGCETQNLDIYVVCAAVHRFLTSFSIMHIKNRTASCLKKQWRHSKLPPGKKTKRPQNLNSLVLIISFTANRYNYVYFLHSCPREIVFGF